MDAFMHPYNLQEMKSLLILPVSAIVSVKIYFPVLKSSMAIFRILALPSFVKSFWCAHPVLVNEAKHHQRR